MKFSLPYIDQPIEFWQELEEKYSEYIEDIYFPFPSEQIKSARPNQPLKHMYTFLIRSKLSKNLVINPIILDSSHQFSNQDLQIKLGVFLNSYNIEQITVKDFTLARQISQLFPNVNICASVLNQIYSAEQTEYIPSCINYLVPDTSLVRNLNTLSQIRAAFKGKLKLIVNEGCIAGCVYRVQHFYEMAHADCFPASLCDDLLAQKPWLSLKGSWVLPQHLYFFDGLFDVIKISGRVTLQNPEKYMQVFKAYLLQTHLKPHEIGCGPACVKEEIEITADFFYKTITCSKNCHQCTICKDYYEKHTKR